MGSDELCQKFRFLKIPRIDPYQLHVDADNTVYSMDEAFEILEMLKGASEGTGGLIKRAVGFGILGRHSVSDLYSFVQVSLVFYKGII